MTAVVIGTAPIGVTSDALRVARHSLECSTVLLVQPDDKPEIRGEATSVLRYAPPFPEDFSALLRSLPIVRERVRHLLIAWNMPGPPPLAVQAFAELGFPGAHLWLARAFGELIPIAVRRSRDDRMPALRRIETERDLEAALVRATADDVFIVADRAQAEMLRARLGIDLRRIFVVPVPRTGSYPAPYSVERVASITEQARQLLISGRRFAMIPSLDERRAAGER